MQNKKVNEFTLISVPKEALEEVGITENCEECPCYKNCEEEER